MAVAGWLLLCPLHVCTPGQAPRLLVCLLLAADARAQQPPPLYACLLAYNPLTLPATCPLPPLQEITRGRNSADWSSVWRSIRGVWASQFTSRAVVALSKAGLDLEQLQMAVLCQVGGGGCGVLVLLMLWIAVQGNGVLWQCSSPTIKKYMLYSCQQLAGNQ